MSITSEYLLNADSPAPPLVGLSVELLEAPASDNLSPGFIRFAANPPGLGVAGVELADALETDATEGEEVQFFVPARAERGRPPDAPANGPLGDGPGAGPGAFATEPCDVVGIVPVEEAWAGAGGAPCRESEKAFILAKMS